MSRIDDLIAQHCQNGVEYTELKKLATITIGEFVHKNKQNPEGQYPVYNGGTSPTGLYDEFNNSGEKIIVSARGANAGFVNKITVPYWAGNSCYSIGVKDKNKLNWTFVYYYLKNFEYQLLGVQQKGGIPAVSKKQIETLSIPVLPIDVQQEIVDILDKFTKLEAELEAELEARQQQYSHYRDELLNFDGKDVPLLDLDSVCVKTLNIKWKEHIGEEYEYIDLSSVDRENNQITETQKISDSNAPSRAQQIVQKDDIIFGTTRPTLKRFCVIPEAYDGQICSTGFCVLRADPKKILPKFLYFSITTSAFNDYVERNQEGAGYPSISNSKVKSFQISVPAIEEQKRIVAILDKFDALVNDISSGLPAEITARRQQYEHYRNKLLTFQEAA